MFGPDIIFGLIALVFSIVIHEVMHGVAADRLGDPTARYAGRLTLNPIPHIDLWGSIIVPVMLVISQSPIFFGWAKPVPYNPYNLRPGRFSEAIVAIAGPLSNLVIAIIVALILRVGLIDAGMSNLLFYIVYMNVLLFVFNLIPVPPLDGSKVLESLLPRGLARGYSAWRNRLEMNPLIGMGLVLIIVIFFGNAFGGIVIEIAEYLSGMNAIG